MEEEIIRQYIKDTELLKYIYIYFFSLVHPVKKDT